MEYLSSNLIGFDLEKYVDKSIPKENKEIYENSFLIVWKTKKMEQGIFAGRICKTCDKFNLKLNDAIYCYKENLKNEFKVGAEKFYMIHFENSYKNRDTLLFESISKAKAILQIINDVIFIDIDYILRRLYITKNTIEYYKKYTYIIDNIITTSPSNLNYKIDIIKNIYIFLKLKERGVFNLSPKVKSNLKQALAEWDNLDDKSKTLILFNKRLVELSIPVIQFRKLIELRGGYISSFNKKLTKYMGGIGGIGSKS